MNSPDPLSIRRELRGADNRVHTPRSLPVYLKLFRRLGRNIPHVLAVAVIIGGLSLLHAEDLKEARVTQIVKDVRLMPEQASPRPATVNDSVRDGTAVRTGVQSRSELTFTDQTITRLGANTLFSFKEGTRVMDLGEGAMLFQVPKGSGGATIRTAAVTAAITGTTGIGEFHHATSSNPHPVIKWLCLEGTIHLYLTNGSKESVELRPGEMEVTDGNTLNKPVAFDLAALVRTSLFFTGFKTTLPSWPLIAIEIQHQLDRIGGGSRPHNFLLDDLTDPSRIIDVVDQGITAQSSPPSESPTVSPTPSPTVSPTATPTATPSATPTVTPGKFGELVTITSPDPYVIGSNTTITTDPTITTDGQTDLGKIYRDPSQDGALSMYLFGSTSEFDAALDSDHELVFDGMAVFKFTALQLTGDPSVSTTGGPDILGLIAVNGITSGGPGGVLTFDGIHRLLLATQNGSINLGSGISFSGLDDITFYARGANSMLILGSDVETNNSINLWGEGGIVLTGNLSTRGLFASTNGNFDVDSGSISARTISIMADGNINFTVGEPLSFDTDSFSLQANGDIHFDSSLEIIEDNAAQTGGFNISLFSGNSPTRRGNIAIDGNLSLTIRANDIAGSALMNMRSGGDTTIDGDVNLLIDSSNGGHNGGLAAMSIGSGADFAADNFLAVIDNQALGFTGSATLAINVTGDLTTDGFLDLEIANTGFSDSAFVGGGHIANSAVISLLARNISADDYLQAFIFNDGEGRIDGNALINAHATGAMSSKSDIFFDIENAADNDGESITAGGMIGGDASVIFSAGGAVSAGGVVEFAVLNNDFRFLEEGGSIEGDATVTVIAASIMAGEFFQPLINNTNGSIGGDAAVTVVVSGLTDIGSFGFFRVTNDTGSIGGDAFFTFDGGNVSIGDTLFAEIQNRARGEIGGDALLAFQASNLTVSDTANFQILNGQFDSKGNITPGGMIGGDADVDVSVANLTAPVLVGDVDNTGGQIGGNATVLLTATGSFNTTVAAFAILNGDNGEGAGTIGGDALIDISAGGNFTTNTFAAVIDNQNGGLIGTSARIFLDLGGTLSTDGDVLFQIQGGFDGVLPHALGAAGLPPDTSIEVDATALSVGGNLDARIDSGGGGITGDATIDMNVTGSATVTDDATFEILGSDDAGSAAINFNGGNYNVGGTFLANIDGNGTITFNNASVHADVLKAGVFGTNGVLNVGGGTLSADTTLKLYAPGSNGQLNFVSNVTLGGNSAKILAANSITIFNNVVVTIGGTAPADVYTGFTIETPNANYTGFGGNGTTTGTFAGAGANDPQPLDQAPPFGTARPAAPATTPKPAAGRSPTRNAHVPGGQPRNRTRSPRPIAKTRPPEVVNVRDSDELISLIHRSTQGSDQATAGAQTPRSVAGTSANGRDTANRTNAARNQAQVRSNLPSSAARLP